MSNPTEPQITGAESLLDNLLGLDSRRPGVAASLPAAIRIVERLEPAGGMSVPVFPASYAGPTDQSPPVYDLSGIEYGEVEERVRVKKGSSTRRQVLRARLCALDAPQSQANRMEPAFVDDESLRVLVPQAMATIPRAPGKESNEHVLRLPHRVADFRVRLSNQKSTVQAAVSSFAKGNALPLLRILPTSVLFGFWDSRGDGTKHARILLARIDAFDVIPCQRHALYNGPYSKEEFATVVLDDSTRRDADEIAEKGFSNAPSEGLGGVIVQDRIERMAILSFTDIARIGCCGEDQKLNKEQTNAARRYLFALAALAEGYARSSGSHRLRSGCELVPAAGDNLTIDLRGGAKEPKDATEIKEMFVNRDLLIQIAARAKKILAIPDQIDDFVVTKVALKEDFDGATPAGSDNAADKPAGRSRPRKS